MSKPRRLLCPYAWGVLYLLLPVLLFTVGFCRYAIGVPLGALLILAARRTVGNQPEAGVIPHAPGRQVCLLILLIAVWALIAGVGGFVWQNRLDHMFRNAVFRDLVTYPWPVVEGDTALCYYLGYWLPAALVGKLAGLNAGCLFQLLWAVLGIWIAFSLICEYLGTVKIRNLLVFIFFSGCDFGLYALFQRQVQWIPALSDILQGVHIELSVFYFNSSSNTTLLFWLYNQAVPFWVGFMLLLLQKNNRSMAFLYSLLLLCAPFPCVGMAPLMVYLVLSRGADGQGTAARRVLRQIRAACSFENLAAVPPALAVLLYLKSNAAAAQVSLLKITPDMLILFAFYLIFEYAVYLAFLRPLLRGDTVFKVLGVSMVLCSFVTMGAGYDFAWRTCIPFAFYLMILVMKRLSEGGWNREKCILALVFLLCAITPASEMIRTAREETRLLQNLENVSYFDEARSGGLDTVFDKERNYCYDNFTASLDELFFRVIARQSPGGGSGS